MDDSPDLTVDTLHLLRDMDLTHRMVLSAVYRIYDQHGLLTPVTSRFKILLCKVVKLKVEWNEVLPQELAEKFKRECELLVRADSVIFPRSVKPVGKTGSPEIVGFWDSWDPAFGCCLYACYQLEQHGSSGETHAVQLLAGKAHVTPIKRNTSL